MLANKHQFILFTILAVAICLAIAVPVTISIVRKNTKASGTCSSCSASGSSTSASSEALNAPNAKKQENDAAGQGGWKATPQIHVDALYWLTDRTVRLLNELGIDYRMVAGTLLGAARHQGLIPFDGDIDLAVMRSAIASRLPEIERRATELGMTVVRTNCPRNGLILKIKKREGAPKTAQLDLFTLIPFDGGLTLGTGVEGKCRGTKELLFDASWIQNEPRVYTFGPLQLKGPPNPDAVLRRGYGDDWDKVAKPVAGWRTDHSVIYGKPIDLRSFSLPPALPSPGTLGTA